MEDIPAMMDLYAQARVFMREHGNPNQWDDSYPSRELLEKDIAFGNSYIVEDDEKNLAATFAFIKGEDPTYYGIENGAWLNHEPYGTIHRLAGNTSYHGIASGCISWCKSQIGNLRADTHEDNKIMQHLLEKNGFVRCGIIHLANGAPRIAYQFAGDSADYWSVREVPSGERGFGIASMVLGIIALVLFFSFVNIPLAILSVIFGIIQLTRKAPKGMAISGIVMSTISLFLLVIFWACMFVSDARTESTDNSTYYYEGSENDDASGDYYDGLYEGYQQGYKDGYYDGYYGYTPDEEFYGHTPDDSFYGYLPNDDSYNFHGKNGIYY
ncbi:hypothetical protein ROSEINA2194_00545 [Roseburia inulinivorans DSM 16841]|uniref:N-acetyltransferase domain-containing protein n=2 Tax=Roseburia inulinivorans TaxID=360807 RepID=C0FP93_9FIRM|nr:hypothetical protein ROSEINA2194_00545 [Roseburia inulinivorans DSM 16841]